MKAAILLFVFLMNATPTLGDEFPWWRQVSIYEIFVRSFQDSNNDGIGDLNGIRRRLDYLKSEQSTSLGVGALWLTPIFPTKSYHGYDVIDYRNVNSEYGTLDDFDLLVKEIHRRGLKIILDLPINHSSAEHPWFLNSKTGEGAEFRDWYLWRKEKPWWGRWFLWNEFFYFSVFDAEMPQLNWKNLSVVSEVESIVDFWIQRGVDGFRLDAARYYVPGLSGQSDTEETHQSIQGLAKHIKRNFPEILLLGEVWADSSTIATYYHEGSELDMAFSFPLAFGILDSLKENSTQKLARAIQQNKSAILQDSFNAPFLTNHDMDRVSTQLSGDPKKLALAISCLMSLPGTPVIYYGEEISLPNGRDLNSSGDRNKRVPMQWTAKEGYGFTTSAVTPWQPFVGIGNQISVEAQIAEGSLLSEYKKLIKLRANTPTLQNGELSHLYEAVSGTVLSWQRSHLDHRLIWVGNFSSQDVTDVKIPFEFHRESSTPFFHHRVLYSSGTPNLATEIQFGQLKLLHLAAHSSALIELFN